MRDRNGEPGKIIDCAGSYFIYGFDWDNGGWQGSFLLVYLLTIAYKQNKITINNNIK